MNYYGGSDILAFKYIPVPEYEETRSIYDDYPHSGTDDSNDGRGSLYDDYPRNDDDDSGGLVFVSLLLYICLPAVCSS